MKLESAPPGPAAESPALPDRIVSPFRWSEILLLLALWVAACRCLALHWSINPEYHFGYFVPWLALYTGWQRWRCRPTPDAPIRGSATVAAILTLTVLAVWVLAQPSPDWPLLNWTLTAQVVAISLALIGAAGGWSWVRHFAFPAIIIFTAIPWPDYVESPLTQGLMRLVAGVSVNLLDLIGIGALQHGNLIEVGSGVVGVDEACSGVRSLHGSFMASVVLGELFRLNVSRRLILIGTSLVAAFVTNVVRAAFLAWSAAHAGVGSVDRWHDPAGMTILAICVALILVTAMALDRGTPDPLASDEGPAPSRLPGWLGPSLAAWVFVGAVATELWFYESGPTPIGPFRIEPIAGSEHLRIPTVALSSFHSTEAVALKGTGPARTQWLLYFFHWDFGPAFSRIAASMHNPELCLPGGGRELNESRGEMTVSVAGRDVRFHAYSFREGDRLLFVYHGIWAFQSPRGAAFGPLSFHKHIATVQSVIRRERNLGQQSAELVVSGCRTNAEADAAFRQLISELLVPRAPSPS